MGSYVFRWAHAADEVFVTGTFDDWGKTVKLEKIGDIFEKEVDLPEADGKVHYKFVVDGSWITDKTAREEEDGWNNTNNVLLPEEIKKPEPSTEEGGAATLTEDGKKPAAPAEEDGANEEDEGSKEFHILPVDVNKPAEPTEEDGAATLPEGNAPEEVMAGVSPDSTTAGLAAQVPKESVQKQEALDTATISSAAPESTTAELAKDVPLENKAEGVPGIFPETPAPETSANEPEQFSVNPLPATNGIGNPIHLQPGEKVPDPSTFTSNTIESTVSTDQAGYERDASVPVVSGLTPAEVKADASGALNVPPVSSTTIPESSLPMNPPATDTTDPGPTIQSAAPNSSTTELAAEVPLEEDKDKGKEKQKEANGKAEAPAAQVPDVVKKSLEEAHAEPEAAANEEAVEEKIEVDDEFLDTVKPTDDYLGQPAPTASAIAAETAPRPTEQPDQQPLAKDSSPVSAPQPPPSEPTVTTGVASAKTTEVSEPKNGGLTRSFTRKKDKKDKDKDKEKKEKKEETETDADGKDKKKVKAFFTKIMRANTIRGRFNQVKESKEAK
ncbi:hypothetical protein VTN00DRAFT_1552 [Thermoascus crustaceus]|uniref:uncharacterized protein n=1 Tax=Thermoascus crustaceus TaxID=5088 RepID=UPI0037436372